MSKKPKKGALSARLTPQQKAASTRAKKAELDRANAQRLAQIVNLSIAGMSLAEIGAAVGATEAEIDSILQKDVARFVRNQPALRVYVRNWISSRYMKMIDANYDIAIDPNHEDKLDNQTLVVKMLREMDRLHGAAAPAQTEIKIEAAPETVEKMVQVLSAAQGVGYDANIFDVVEAEVVHEATEEAALAEIESGEAVGEGDESL